ncbi:hypothetical protein [Vibrio hippocampi]|uniref:Uncharacterized protein n=1 Tax=Vibrio hippocampi TaxID=654686 RepID=A0ABN8DCN8_9VIBR|nr:hypothetical protein [Vibrio hippocampi]CAH0524255.1 hypothetical protein VHP8226_00057 [Vibrio hippocampi]
MRPTTVRFSHTNRSAMRRRSGFAAAFVAKKTATPISLVEKEAALAPVTTQIVRVA